MSEKGRPLVEKEIRIFQEFFVQKFDGQMLPLDVVIACWSHYKKGVWGIFEDNKLIAALDMWPVKKSFIEELRAGERSELSLSKNDLDLRSGMGKTWLIGGLAREQGFRNTIKTRKLLYDFFMDWVVRVEKKLPVSVYSFGFSLEGIQILTNSLGFKRIQKGGELKDNMDLYKGELNTLDQLKNLPNYLRIKKNSHSR